MSAPELAPLTNEERGRLRTLVKILCDDLRALADGVDRWEGIIDALVREGISNPLFTADAEVRTHATNIRAFARQAVQAFDEWIAAGEPYNAELSSFGRAVLAAIDKKRRASL